jgi:hypothetical protein
LSSTLIDNSQAYRESVIKSLPRVLTLRHASREAQQLLSWYVKCGIFVWIAIHERKKV